MKNGTKIISLLLALALCLLLSVCVRSQGGAEAAMPVKVLILPNFEVGELSGDYPGEAQYYYENYFDGCKAYDIDGNGIGPTLYYKDGLAMCVLGEGKVNCAADLTAILLDSRFDFGNAYVLTVGCGGGAYGRSVIGDVFLITGVADFDVGHRADIRELSTDRDSGWFREYGFDQFGYVVMDQALVDEVYPLIKDMKPHVGDDVKEYMAKHFDNAEWATRDPMVVKGSSVTGDCYWKGTYLSDEATMIAESYGLPDPFMITEMEDIAIGLVLGKMGMQDRYLGVRVNVNMDVFTGHMTPENTWGEDVDETLLSEDESANSFEDGMKNLFDVSSVVIDYLAKK